MFERLNSKGRLYIPLNTTIRRLVLVQSSFQMFIIMVRRYSFTHQICPGCWLASVGYIWWHLSRKPDFSGMRRCSVASSCPQFVSHSNEWMLSSRFRREQSLPLGSQPSLLDYYLLTIIQRVMVLDLLPFACSDRSWCCHWLIWFLHSAPRGCLGIPRAFSGAWLPSSSWNSC